MSLEVIKTQIREFLRSKEPEVLAIRGDWGVGKTFTWDETLQEAQQQKFQKEDAGAIGLTYYSYVSLFGISNLQDLRTEIAFNKLNTIDLKHAEGVTKYKKVSGKFGPKIISQLIQTTGISAGTLVDTIFASVSNSMIKDTIVCIDDFERSTIDEKEALGFINDLKCKRGCKVVILLNDTHTKQFKTYREKVIDYDIRFKTTPNEAILMALKGYPETDYHQYIFEFCQRIETTNVRIIKKIRALTENMLSKVKIQKHRNLILNYFIQTSVLAHYCFYASKENLPDIDYLLNLNEFSSLAFSDFFANESPESLTPEEAKEKKLNADRLNFLANYGKEFFDKFDESIIKSVVDGFVDKPFFEKWLIEKIDEIDRNEATVELSKSIKSFYSKIMTDKEVRDWAQDYVENFCRNVENVSKWDLNDSYRILTKLELIKERNEIVRHYIDQNSHQIKMLDTNTREDMRDVEWIPELKDLLDENYRRRKAPPTPRDVIKKMIIQNGHAQREEVEILKQLDGKAVDEMVRNLSPNEFRSTVSLLANIRDFHPELKGLQDDTRFVLQKIGGESKQARLLAEHYGVSFEHD